MSTDIPLSSQPQNLQAYLNQLMRFCSVQERSENDVRKKLALQKCPAQYVEDIITKLKSENFLDDYRYARAFCRGKFRINEWGRIKITAALVYEGIPMEAITEAMKEIDETEYREALRMILEKKHRITPGQGFVRKNKTALHAISKGYESSLVYETLNEIIKK